MIRFVIWDLLIIAAATLVHYPFTPLSITVTCASFKAISLDLTVLFNPF